MGHGGPPASRANDANIGRDFRQLAVIGVLKNFVGHDAFSLDWVDAEFTNLA
jgi:hypothetical protein